MNRRIGLPCGCSAWKLGATSGETLCSTCLYDHVLSLDGYGSACRCLRCRARRRGVTPWTYCADRLDEEASRRAGPGVMPHAAQILDCGCIAVRLTESAPWVVANVCLSHCDVASVAAIESQLNPRPAPAVAPVEPPAPNAPAPSRWRRLVDLVTRRVRP